MERFLFELAAIVLLLVIARCGDTDVEDRRPTPVEAAEPAAPGQPNRIDGVFHDEPRERKDSIGSAFAVAPGVWITARHVIDSCDTVGLAEAGSIYTPAISIRYLRDADAALIRHQRAGTPVQVAPAFAVPGSIGIHVGYPHGEPAVVRSELIGTLWTRTEGDWVGEEPMAAWTEVARYPDFEGSLGGISGGPVFNRAGQVIGINVRGTPRRGRVLTAMPETLFRLLDEDVRTTLAGKAAFVDLSDLAASGERLRAGQSVAMVACDVL